MFLRPILLAVGLIFAASAAQAQTCTFTVSSLTFSGLAGLTNGTRTTSGTVAATCTGVVGTLGYCIRPNIGSGSGGASGGIRFLRNGASTIGYQLFSDSAMTMPWGSALDPNVGGTAPLITIPLAVGLGARTASIPIYAKLTLSGPAAAGTYSSTFPDAGTTFQYRSITVGNCSVVPLIQTAQPAPFTISTEVTRACEVTATALNFGTHAVLTTAKSAEGIVSVACTPGTDYTVGLNGGQTGATDPTAREMRRIGVTARVRYGLYRDEGHTAPWGDAVVAERAAGTGSGAVMNLTVYGRVPPQTTPTAGTYTDLVVVTVRYTVP